MPQIDKECCHECCRMKYEGEPCFNSNCPCHSSTIDKEEKIRKDWKKEYKIKFGLCDSEQNLKTCQCKKEIAFIEKLLHSLQQEMVKKLEKMKKMSEVNQRYDYIVDNRQYNEALADVLKIISSNKE